MANFTPRVAGQRIMAADVNNLSLDTIDPATGHDHSGAADHGVLINAQTIAGIYNVKDYGAVGNGIADDTDEIQAAIDAVPTVATHVCGVVLFPPGQYKVTASLVIPTTARGLVLSGYGATLVVAHNGDGIVMTVALYRQKNVIEGLTLIGPNDPYDAGDRPSIGSGILMENAYSDTLYNVNVSGFYKGITFIKALSNVIEGRSYIWNNQYGIYFDASIVASAVNDNTVTNTSVRENWISGIHFSDTIDAAGEMQSNKIIECLIETNTPYPYAPSNAPTDSVGVNVGVSNHTTIRDCYFENNHASIYILNSTSGYHLVDRIRIGYGTDNRIGSITLADNAGGACRPSQFSHIHNINTGAANFISTVTTYDNGFSISDCQGLVFSGDFSAWRITNLTQSYDYVGYEKQTTDLGPAQYLYESEATADASLRRMMKGVGTHTALLDISEFSNLYIADPTDNPNYSKHTLFTTFKNNYDLNLNKIVTIRLNTTPTNILTFATGTNYWLNGKPFTLLREKQIIGFGYFNTGVVELFRSDPLVTVAEHASYIGQEVGAKKAIYAFTDSDEHGITIYSKIADNIVEVNDAGAIAAIGDIISFNTSLGGLATLRTVSDVQAGGAGTRKQLTFSPALGAAETVDPTAGLNRYVYLTRWVDWTT